MVVMFNAKTQEDFLTPQQCQDIIDKSITLDIWEPIPGSVWDKRIIKHPLIHKNMPNDIFNTVKNAILRLKEFIEFQYNLDKEIYPDMVAINRWFSGMSQAPHSDDMKHTNFTGLEGRKFGAIIYLNTEYEGGKTYYPDHGVEITPKVGMLAVHPGDVEHLHGVSEVHNGMRYTISSFWVFEKEKGIDWSFYQ